MDKMPLLLSVPHAGLLVPPELKDYCLLSQELIRKDSDEGAGEIYFPLADSVESLVRVDVARCFVDMNRAPDDRRPDGVVKTHACWGHKLYEPTPPEPVFADLLERLHKPYHAELTRIAATGAVRLGVDCHTMCEKAPPLAPDPEGTPRPLICLSDRNGRSVPAQWMNELHRCFSEAFPGESVKVNIPFRGGYITRVHSAEIPWVQIEINRTARLSNQEKSDGVRRALEQFCRRTFAGDQPVGKNFCAFLSWLKGLLERFF